MEKTPTKKPAANEIKPAKGAPKSKDEIKEADLDKVVGGRMRPS